MIDNLVKELRIVKAKELMANPKNWTTHPDTQRDALAKVLQDVGIGATLTAYDTEDGLRLIDGHLRQDYDPDQEWPVAVLDVDEEKADKLLAALNPLAMMAAADPKKIDELLARYLHWQNSHWHDEGGCKDYRTQEMEKKAIRLLQSLYPGMVRQVTKGGSEFSVALSV